MTNRINLLLACPVCGSTVWIPNKDEDEPCFRCINCNSLEFPENMEAVSQKLPSETGCSKVQIRYTDTTTEPEKFTWQHIEFEDGSNPYISKTYDDFMWMKTHYQLTKIKDNFWKAIDKLDN